MKIVYGVVVYECDLFDIFSRDFFRSIADQDNTEFDLLIISDDVPRNKLDKAVSDSNLNCRVIFKYANGQHSPLELREFLIQKATTLEYDVLVVGDFDETTTNNRVSSIKRNIKTSSLAFNDFYLVDRNNRLISDKSCFSEKAIPDTVDNVEAILSKNFIGLGSTAINLKRPEIKDLVFPPNILAVDWFLATWILLRGGKEVALRDTFAYYRQHESNLVGFDFSLDGSKLDKGTAVKKAHYKFFSNFPSSHKSVFKDLYKSIVEVERYNQNPTQRLEYINRVNHRFDTSSFVWWENIKTLEELEL